MRYLLALTLTVIALAGIVSAADFRVIGGTLVFMDGEQEIRIRHNSTVDINLPGGGSLRVFSNVRQDGTAEIEILARSEASFWFAGRDVVLSPQGVLRASVPDVTNPSIDVSWENAEVTPSNVSEDIHSLLAYFVVTGPPIFSESPISADDLAKVYPDLRPPPSPSPSPSSSPRDMAEVDFGHGRGPIAQHSPDEQKDSSDSIIHIAPILTIPEPPEPAKGLSKGKRHDFKNGGFTNKRVYTLGVGEPSTILVPARSPKTLASDNLLRLLVLRSPVTAQQKIRNQEDGPQRPVVFGAPTPKPAPKAALVTAPLENDPQVDMKSQIPQQPTMLKTLQSARSAATAAPKPVQVFN